MSPQVSGANLESSADLVGQIFIAAPAHEELPLAANQTFNTERIGHIQDEESQRPSSLSDFYSVPSGNKAEEVFYCCSATLVVHSASSYDAGVRSVVPGPGGQRELMLLCTVFVIAAFLPRWRPDTDPGALEYLRITLSIRSC